MLYPVVIGIYGESNSGKTKLAKQIIKHFSKQSYKVATIKKTNKEIVLDEPGKDTWEHCKAGAKIVILSSKNETDIILKNSENTDKMINFIRKIENIDLILIEGSNEKDIPKIRLGDIEKRPGTIFDYEDNLNKIILTIEKMIKKNQVKNVRISVNEDNIPLTVFPENFIKNTIFGMLRSLKGVNEIDNFEIKYFKK